MGTKGLATLFEELAGSEENRSATALASGRLIGLRAQIILRQRTLLLRPRRVYTEGMTNNIIKLVLATTVVLPLSVKAASLTADQAKMATASAIEAAAGNAERIAKVPVEFALMTVLQPYSNEQGVAISMKEAKVCSQSTEVSAGDAEQAVGGGFTIGAYTCRDGIMKAVSTRLAYWKTVSAALAGEKVRLTESLQNPETPAGVLLGDSLRLTKILRFSIAVDALVADCDKDAALVKSIGMQEPKTRQGLLDRKARLFKSLNGMKTTADGESTHLGFYGATAEAVDVLHILPD